MRFGALCVSGAFGVRLCVSENAPPNAPDFLSWTGPILGQNLKFSFFGGPIFSGFSCVPGAFLVRCAFRARFGAFVRFGVRFGAFLVRRAFPETHQKRTRFHA